MKRIAAKVARGREVIVFSFGHEPNQVLRRMWLHMTVAFIENLHSFGYSHIIALAFDAAECDALLAGWDGRAGAGGGSRPFECVWSTVTRRTSGYLGGNSVRALWVARYHTATSLAELGYNVLMMDADCYVARDVYPLLDAYPQYNYIFMRESPVNGGLFYLRNVTARSPSLWLLKQVERRSTLYSKYRARFSTLRPPGLPMDQDVLSALFRVAAGNVSTYDFYEDYLRSENQDHPLWADYPQTPPTTPFGWIMTRDAHSAPWADDCPSDDPAACERYGVYVRRHGFKDVPMHTIRVCVPFDDDAYDERVPCDTALAGPPWLWSHGDIYERGFDASVAVTHLLGVNKNWFNMLAGSHMGRWALLVARAGVKSAPLTSKKRIYLSKAVVEHRLKHNDSRIFKMLIKRFAELADARDAVPVMPALPCDAPWIERADDSRLGYLDHRVVDDGAWCYPSPMGWDSCLLGEHYLHESQAPSPRPGDAVLDARDLSDNATRVVGPLATFCRELFDVDA